MELNNLQLPQPRREELQRLLDAAYKNYADNLANLTDAATDDIETAITRGDLDIKELVRGYTAQAAQMADDYYETTRQLWSEYAGVDLPAYEGGPVDPDRALWQVQGGFSNTDFNGLTYQQVKSGQSRAGMTMDDLWPDLTNIDDAQQFIADMIHASNRLTIQRDMRADPTHPRWARVPQGSKTCAFCMMLASRGFAYTSDETAGRDKGGNYYHDDCKCAVVPSWGKQKLAGYDETALKRTYKDMKTLADREYGGDLLKAYRSTPGLCTDSVIPDTLKKTPGRPSSFDPDKPFRTFLGSRELRAALEGTNPHFGEGPEYENNCQRCVVAYEMRRRGYAVIARPRPMDPNGNPAPDTDSNRWPSAFDSPWHECGGDSGKNEVVRYLREWGVGSRAIIKVAWDERNSHVFVAENLKHGIQFLDPQTGSPNVVGYFDLAVHGETLIMRCDDATPTELVRKYCKEE